MAVLSLSTNYTSFMVHELQVINSQKQVQQSANHEFSSCKITCIKAIYWLHYLKTTIFVFIIVFSPFWQLENWISRGEPTLEKKVGCKQVSYKEQ